MWTNQNVVDIGLNDDKGKKSPCFFFRCDAVVVIHYVYFSFDSFPFMHDRECNVCIFSASKYLMFTMILFFFLFHFFILFLLVCRTDSKALKSQLESHTKFVYCIFLETVSVRKHIYIFKTKAKTKLKEEKYTANKRTERTKKNH